jgi:glycosyltransferase involved in cell wall biosynthesis
MADQPLVSILINNYNYGRYLGEAIDSALAQTYCNTEIVVVDDGSTDNSREVIAHYGDRIHAILKPNGGQASAYNAGFSASHGEILCLLDSDDIYLPGKVTRVVEGLTSNMNLGWFFDVVREFDDTRGSRLPYNMDFRSGEWDMREITRAGSPPYIPTASSGLSFRRRLLGTIFPMPELMTIATGSCSDVYIKWIALAHERGWLCDDELTLMRIHGGNAYTARADGKKRLRGQIELYTGICLYENWPVLQRLGIKIISRGLGRMESAGGLEPDAKRFVSNFRRSLPLRVRLEVIARTAAWHMIELR